MATLNEFAESIADAVGAPYDHAVIERIKFLIKSYRAEFLRNSLDNNKLSDYDLQSFTAELELVDSFDGCINIPGCKFLRTKNTVPRPIRWRYSSPFKSVSPVDRGIHDTKLDKIIIPHVDANLVQIVNSSKFTGNALRYSLINQRIYVFNNTRIRYINIEHFFENPEEVINFCENAQCYTDDMEFPMPSDMFRTIRQVILDEEFKIRTLNNNDQEVTDV